MSTAQGEHHTTPPNTFVAQVGGNHYATEYQHWDLCWDCDAKYFPGQISKYFSRHTKKKGLEDVDKGVSFLVKYLRLLERDNVGLVMPGGLPRRIEASLEVYFALHPHIGPEEKGIIRLVLLPHTQADVRQAQVLAQLVRQQYRTQEE